MSVILHPIITEKSMLLVPEGRYTFEVTPQANKIEIAKEIKQEYKVDVIGVRVINLPGKSRNFRRIPGRTSNRHKAIVTLKKGQKISGFETGK